MASRGKDQPVRKLWSKESMEAAVKAVEEGMRLREAARLYNVPHETLRRRTTGAVAVDCKPGPSTVLTKEEECILAKYCIDMADMGYGLSRENVMRTAYRIVEKSGRKHPFQNGMGGRAWFDSFCARNPGISLRTPQALSFCRAKAANKQTMDEFFAKLGATLARLNLLTKPMQMYNLDETGISIVHKAGKVVCAVGRKHLWSVTSAEKGKTHTVLVCASASGIVLPPMMIYPRQRMRDKLKESAIPGTLFQCSPTGWITQELFTCWFQFFLQNIPSARPVLIIEDGHSSHISIEVIEEARKNDVHFLCLPSHTTHILQPLDVAVFKSFKTNYSKACKQFLDSHPGQVVTSEAIAGILAQAWPQSMTPVNIMSGFRKCGIYPLNPGEVADRMTAPSTVFATRMADTDTSASISEGSTISISEHHSDVYVKSSSDRPSTSLSTSTKPPSDTRSDVSSDLGDILTYPKAPTNQKKRKGRPGLTTSATCITDDEFLQKLKDQEAKKQEEAAAKEARRVERERKKLEKISLTSQKQKGRKPRTRAKSRKPMATGSEEDSDGCVTSEEGSTCTCPRCGLVYGEEDAIWICCDVCNTWFDLGCTVIDPDHIPQIFYCEDCV